MRVLYADLCLPPRFCSKGAREFCERYGIDWLEFVQNGIESSEIEHIDDEMLKQLIERARQRESAGG